MLRTVACDLSEVRRNKRSNKSNAEFMHHKRLMMRTFMLKIDNQRSSRDKVSLSRPHEEQQASSGAGVAICSAIPV
jgi:hypothetical protein